MQNIQLSGITLADIPLGFFADDDAFASTAAPRAAAAPTPFADAPAKASGPVQSRALKIARAISGETELRLLAELDGDAARYVIASSTLAPYVVKREVLVDSDDKKTPLNYQQAVEEFDRRVAKAYPPEKLRNGQTVAIHLNLI